ncbi:hypothetical protein F5Y14DRAFT_410264 [Nemania sp. NC0429]|nr:hypothetical protein F5Y14DRAFT_410264 [Nemania sp. NC0429]
MSFSTKAFDLTPEDQQVMLGRVKELLLRTNTALIQAKDTREMDDYDEANRHLEEALVLATDANACDPARAPLATCYLYKGNIHVGLGQYVAAREAFLQAAGAELHALQDIPAAQVAARQAVRIRRLADEERRVRGPRTKKLSLRGASGSVWGLVSGAQMWKGKGGKVSLLEALSAGAYGTRLHVKVCKGPDGVGKVRTVRPGLRSQCAEIIKMRALPRGAGGGLASSRGSETSDELWLDV